MSSWAHAAKGEPENRAAGRIGLRRYLAAMGLDDRPRDRQADPQALRLGGDEGLEKLVRDFGRDPGTGIDHLDDGHAVLAALGCDREFAARRVFHRFDGVAQQIEHHLLNLHLVRKHLFERGVEGVGHPHAAILCPDKGERACLLEELCQVFDPPLAFAARHEVAQPADDLSGPQRLFGGLVHGLPHHDRPLVRSPFKQPARSLHVARDG